MSYTHSPSKLESILQSRDFALSLAIIIMLTQSIHTSHALYNLTSLPHVWLKIIFAVTTAICMDFLMIFFVAHHAVRISYAFFGFTTLMNIYAYHIDHILLSDIQSVFMCIAGAAVPFAVHAIAMHKYGEVEPGHQEVEIPESQRTTESVTTPTKDQLIFGSDGITW